MTAGTWSLYIPPVPGTEMYRPDPALWPCPLADDPHSAQRLAVVVSIAADLASVRTLMDADEEIEMVLWAWCLPELLALEAEEVAPTVYGPVTEVDLSAAMGSAVAHSDTTKALAALEAAAGFDPAFSMPALG